MLQRLHSQWATQSQLQASEQIAPEIARPGDSWRAALDAIPQDTPHDPLSLPDASLVLATAQSSSGDGTRISGVRARSGWILPLLGGMLAICGTLVVLW